MVKKKLEWIQIILADKTKGSCRFLSVQAETLKKLTRVRGSVYQDDPRLRVVKDLPTPEPEIKISPEMQVRAEDSWHLHCITRDAGTRAAASTPEPVLSFDEQLEHDWRHSPSLRKEFTSFGSYQAYKRAEKAGRTRVCGVS